MPRKSDNRIGLFRLEDLEGMEVEKKALFPGRTTAPAPVPALSEPTARPATSTDHMVELIRRARTRHTSGPSVLDDVGAPALGPTVQIPAAASDAALPPTPPAASDVEPVAAAATAVVAATAMVEVEGSISTPGVEGKAKESTHPDKELLAQAPAGKFDTSEIRAVIHAAEREVARQGRLRRLLWLAIIVPVVGGALAVSLYFLLTTPPPLLETTFPIQVPLLSEDTSDLTMVDVFMIPEPEPVAPPEPERAPSRSRRSRDRSSRQTPALDPGSLF